MRDDVGDLARVRSRLVRTTGAAAAAIVVVAIGGVVVASAGWTPVAGTAVWVTVGTVAVAFTGLVRAALLFRALATPVVAPRDPAVPPRSAVEVGSAGSAPRLRVPESDSAPFAVGDQRGEMLATLSQRLQSLVNQLIRKIDRVENEIEDPDLLHMVWEVDHLATRARRETENIAVLGGEALQRRSDTPVDVNAVLRAAVAEVQHYRRVTKIPVHNASIQGHVVSEVIHLLAELVENAASFTPDDAPKVAVRAHYVAAGLEILVQDRGLGMYPEDMETVNRLLNGTTQVDIGRLLKDGRIGLAVVKELAQRHGIAVQLQSNIYGGVDASVVLPDALLGPRPTDEHSGSRRHRRPFQPSSGEPRPQVTAADLPSLTSQGPAGSAQHTAAPPHLSPSPAGAGPIVSGPIVSGPIGSGPAGAGSIGSGSIGSGSANSGPIGQPLPPVAAPTGWHGRTTLPDGRHEQPGQTDQRAPQPGHVPAEPLPSPPERRRPGSALAALEGRLGLDLGEQTAAWTLTETPQAPAAPDLATTATMNTVRGGTPPEAGFDRPAGRPPLPHRRARQTYLRPELHTPTGHTRPIPGHNPDLMADLHLGQALGDAELEHGDTRVDDAVGSPGVDTPDSPPHQPPLTHAQGDTSSWPRI